MKIISLTFILTFLIAFSGYSQNTVSGSIIDAKTKEPIPYVNIGIIKLMKGTVSDDSGVFMLSYKSEKDTVTFSAIGYGAVTRTVAELMENGEVLLSPVLYELEEITVQKKALEGVTELGYNLRKRGESVGFGSTQLGTEIGGLLEIDRETIIYSAHFTFNNTSKDGLLYRVNIYEMENGKPLKNLIPENVLLETPYEPGTVSVNLSKYNIITEKDVLLSLEWVKAVPLSEDEIQDITFRVDKTRRNPNTWFRSTSFAPFVKFDEFVKYNLGFYITAQQVKK